MMWWRLYSSCNGYHRMILLYLPHLNHLILILTNPLIPPPHPHNLIHLIDKHNKWYNNTCHNSHQLNNSRPINPPLNLNRCITLHTPIIISNNQYIQHSSMHKPTSIILIHINKWQIDQNIQHKNKRES